MFLRLSGLRRGPQLLWLLVTSVVVGCVQQQSMQSSAPLQPPTPEAAAQASLRNGDYVNAAAQFSALANDPGANRDRFIGQAAMVYADLGDHEHAQALLAKLAPPLHPSGLLAQSTLKLVQNDFESSLFGLNALDPTSFDDYTRGLFLRNLGKAQLLAHDRAATVNLLNAELFGMPPRSRTELTQLIWRALNQGDAEATFKQANQRNDNLAGWNELHFAYHNNLSSAAALGAALGAWRTQHAAHPANEILLDELIEQAEHVAAPLHKVALILAFDGQLAEYSGALRDGFIAMRLAAHDTELMITTHSATGAAAVSAYDQAVAEGAELVIGPLDKPGIEALAKRNDRKIPILALNTIDTLPVVPQQWPRPYPAMLQFGLTPEDEAEDLAHRAWQDGHRRMGALVPNSDLGTRLANAFKRSWEQAGGVVVQTARYASAEDGYKAAIREIFSLAQSEARAAALRRLLQRPLVFTAQRRTDVDGVMLVAGVAEGRQLMPQFGQLGIVGMPIYATSSIFSGTVSEKTDSDLGDLTFGSTPWLLGTADHELRTTLDHHFPRQRADFQRFYALGVDAYRIAKGLSQFASGNELNGATGRTLRLDPQGKVKRTLTWARYRDGVPQLLSN